MAKSPETTEINPDDQPVLKGEINYNMQKYLRTGLIAALIAVFGVAAFAFISFFAVPFALSVIVSSLFFGSVMYLAAISYGIVNDLIGTHKNLPYFSLGHQPEQKGVIKSNDPKAVGIAWGVLATAPLAIPAAIAFSVTTLIAGFFVPLATFILPVIVALIPIVLVVSCISANRKAKARKENRSEDQAFFELAAKEILLPQDQFVKETGYERTGCFDNYQKPRLKHMLKNKDDVNSWFTNSDRNVGGFIGMPIVGLIGLASVITLSAAYYVLPAIVFTASFAIFPPLAIGILLAVGVIAACCYLAVKHKTQIKNRFNLNYEPEISTEKSEPFKSTHSHVNSRLDANPNVNIGNSMLAKTAENNKVENNPANVKATDILVSNNSSTMEEGSGLSLAKSP